MAPYPFKVGNLTVRRSKRFCSSVHSALERTPKFKSRSNRPLQMESEDQLQALTSLHLQEHIADRPLLQSLKEDALARTGVA